MKHKQTVNTPRIDSWAFTEAKRVVVPNMDWRGKPSILIPGFDKATVLGPIDHKWVKVFNG